VKALPQDYAVLVWWDAEENQYVARCMEIPPCVGIGETPGEAVMSAYRAVEAHLDHREHLELDPPQTTTSDQRHGRRTLHRLGSLELIRALKAKQGGPDLHVVQADEEFDYEAMMHNELHQILVRQPDEEEEEDDD
jgi:predicted RNase H-like HicB family nuclease